MTQPDGELRAAIVQDAESGRVLMLAWMDAEAERRTRESGEAWFWSRSRRGVLAQGRDARQHDGGRGAPRRLRRRRAARARRPSGPACHTGSLSCFAPALWRTISERAATRPEGSYTTKLLDGASARARRRWRGGGRGRACRARRSRTSALVEEAADLVYHLYVLLASRGVDIAAVEDELARRVR